MAHTAMMHSLSYPPATDRMMWVGVMDMMYAATIAALADSRTSYVNRKTNKQVMIENQAGM